jgi:hypothetical protein
VLPWPSRADDACLLATLGRCRYTSCRHDA